MVKHPQNQAHRIGIDARLNAYREGGIPEYTRRLIEGLATLDSTNDYCILEHTKAQTSLIPADAPHFHAKRVYTPPHHRLERVALGLEITPLRLDLLHSPDYIPPHFGAKCNIISIHDLTFLHYPQFQTEDSLRYYAGNIHAAAKQAAHILTDAEAIKAEISERLDVPAEKVTVHPLGVSENFRPLTEAEIGPVLERWKLPTDGYILCVGTFEPRKNLPGLLTAYHLLRTRRADLPPLVLVGRRGWLYESIFEQVRTLGLEHAVKWLEDLPFTDLPAVYNGASVLTTPSFYEGFGFPALEAMACGVPTVVSNRGSLPEVVGDTGLLIDPDQPEALAEALTRALGDTAFRAQSRSAGIIRAAGFQWQRTAEIVLSVYRRALESML